ncbi:sugar kinase [Streptomyces sp. MTZ3.1]|uniref:Sugar kinase n=2 Tax=Streptomyces meridianus TaxID=2938945 RepID=A0ABT0X3U3_9ACTN|nr:sugar kinase [Streptomyces meridianus]
MVTFVPAPAPGVAPTGRLADVAAFARGIGGAESNVACALARSGHTVRWVGRVGADGFGDHLVDEIAAAGVDTSAVQRDPGRPTGIYFRTAGERAAGPGPVTGPAVGPDPAVDASPAPAVDAGPVPGIAEVAYYRSGSAASAMSPSLMPREHLWSGQVLHLTGITGALSPGCLALMRDLTTRVPGRPLVSFDVNHRPALWRGRPDGPDVLAGLARGCDLLLVGEDEAEALWGLDDPQAVRDAFPEPDVLVVKQGAAGATAFARPSTEGRTDEVATAPALTVDVVAPTGAGDAFAAGFLSATLRGLPLFRRLRHGHLLAAAVLTVPGDLADPPSRDHADRLAAADPETWADLRLGPGWTSHGAMEQHAASAPGTAR